MLIPITVCKTQVSSYLWVLNQNFGLSSSLCSSSEFLKFYYSYFSIWVPWVFGEIVEHLRAGSLQSDGGGMNRI